MGEGIRVRLTSQNQIFLDTWRPTRMPITAAMLEGRIPGFKRGRDTLLRVQYKDKNATAYHLYEGGETWVPTAPKTIAKPGERLRIETELLTSRVFLANFPPLRFRMRPRKRAWTTEWVEAKIGIESDKVALHIKQDPPMEGISSYGFEGRHHGKLTFQKSSVFATIEVLDVFNRPTTFQLHHNGSDKAWISRHTKASARIRLLSFDGVRLRILYQLSGGVCSTVMYMGKPSALFELGEIVDFASGVDTPGLEKRFRVEEVRPVRAMETAMIWHGRCYEAGRIGAEISYAIVSEILRAGDLILNEPARGGTDLFTANRKVLVESRFITDTSASSLSEQIAMDLAKLTRRIRNDFRWNPGAEVGYVVLSYLKNGRVSSLVAEMPRPK